MPLEHAFVSELDVVTGFEKSVLFHTRRVGTWQIRGSDVSGML